MRLLPTIFRFGIKTTRSSQFRMSLSAEVDQVLLVAGASGCGKSTLVRCINGLVRRSYKGELHGVVQVNGVDTTGLALAQIAQHVGTVIQNPEKQIVGAYVKKEVAFGPGNLGWWRCQISTTMDEVLARLGISHLRKQETARLSGGEKQEIALAGVLAMHRRCC